MCRLLVRFRVWKFDLAAAGATPVYQLLGKQGLVMPDPMPQADVGYISGDLAHRLHNGGHTDAPDWPAFLQFASKYLSTKALAEKKSNPASPAPK